MYEQPAEPVIPMRRFVRRLMLHLGFTVALFLLSLGVGTAGFHWLAAQAPLDALLNAATVLGGVGPIGDLTQTSAAGKLFTAAFALYSGLVFVIAAGFLIAPVFHRVLHTFHQGGRRGRS